MTLRGRFGQAGRPYIDAYVHFPRFAKGGPVSFLVDTGADASLLSHGDARRILAGDVDELVAADAPIRGIGELEGFAESVQLAFVDVGSLKIYERTVAIPQDPELAIPSLLGRDVLDHWRMVYDPGLGRLSLEPRRADRTVPLLPPAADAP